MTNLYFPIMSKQLPRLRDAFWRRGIRFGMATSTAEMNSQAGDIFRYHAAQIIPGDQMKMAVVEPVQGIFVHEQNDVMRGLCDSAHGHCLYWGQRFPAWLPDALSDATTAGRYAILETWIVECMTHYSGWNSMDVINEGFTTGSHWLTYIGPESIPFALHTARQAAPNVPIYYNGVFLGLPDERKAVLDLIDKGLLDGVGVQWHRVEGVDETPWIPELVQFTRSCGLPIRMSEVTIKPKGNPAAHAEKWREAVRVALEIEAIDFVQWGIQDSSDSWQGDSLMFDRAGKPKTAFWAVLDELK